MPTITETEFLQPQLSQLLTLFLFRTSVSVHELAEAFGIADTTAKTLGNYLKERNLVKSKDGVYSLNYNHDLFKPKKAGETKYYHYFDQIWDLWKGTGKSKGSKQEAQASFIHYIETTGVDPQQVVKAIELWCEDAEKKDYRQKHLHRVFKFEGRFALIDDWMTKQELLQEKKDNPFKELGRII